MDNPENSKLGPLFTKPLEPTMGLTIADLNRYLSAIRRVEEMDMLDGPKEGLFLGDGLSGMQALPDDSIDLVVADPPNSPWEGPDLQGKPLTLAEYFQWNQVWLQECRRILKATGAIYLFSDWRSSGMYHALLSEIFKLRTRITYRQAGTPSESPVKGWRSALGDVWFATKSNDFFFRASEQGHEDYRDVLPRSNLWGDIIEARRESTAPVRGEKPELVLRRIILASTTKLNWVVDPFMRAGGTGVAAKKLGRRFIGMEVNQDNLLLAMKRIDTK